MAHNADEDASFTGCHITGSLCSVDYGFASLIAGHAKQTGAEMPPLTNIVRTYRGLALTQINRLHNFHT